MKLLTLSFKILLIPSIWVLRIKENILLKVTLLCPKIQPHIPTIKFFPSPLFTGTTFQAQPYTNRLKPH